MTEVGRRVWLYVVAFLLVAALSGGAVLAYRQGQGKTEEIRLSTPSRAVSTANVEVSGAVSNPGIYPLRRGDTIQTLLAEAGLKPEADAGSLRIHVPLKGQAAVPQRVDLNRAEAWLLQALPGIGETRAQAIVDYRVKNGPFARVEDLLKVTGISRTTVDKMRDLVTLGE